ncbi:hypothetical protein BTVI_51435 [Pitangus sulphuratus]|nr:hypothetical protein BTVI_51435 [Pitangus sulphuratus]
MKKNETHDLQLVGIRFRQNLHLATAEQRAAASSPSDAVLQTTAQPTKNSSSPVAQETREKDTVKSSTLLANFERLTGTVDITEGRNAIHGDLGKLEKWAHKNFMEFNNDKSKMLYMGWDNSRPSVGRALLKSSLAKPSHDDDEYKEWMEQIKYYHVVKKHTVKAATDKALPRSLMDSTLARGKSGLEPAGTGSIGHRVTFWQLLTETTPIVLYYQKLAMQTQYTIISPQIIDKDITQDWPQYRALGNITCDWPQL